MDEIVKAVVNGIVTVVKAILEQLGKEYPRQK